jgi:hypothetical protein
MIANTENPCYTALSHFDAFWGARYSDGWLEKKNPVKMDAA